ncbi:transcription factor Pf2 [Stemphylium lycopersici]|uniref:Transcription factor Pf2 n=1 Tax=Stemphylium lycopersici TaxID=183478 RepID=A0A364MSU3_STELY|nr:c6 zinc finger domain containing protein [Stemphylium lycopersici]RAQ98756.1 transcription factor Pf2 [Stemphylium lycopersici]RAR02000.1 transcription factor Pf2 [Stemphylium lycopersici]
MPSTAPIKRACNKQGQFTSELLETKHQAQLAAGFQTDLGFDSRSLPSTFAPTPGLLPRVLVDSCIYYFFRHVYPSEPVLHRQQAQKAIDQMCSSTEAYCMIAALCAYVMIHAHYKPPVSVLPRPEMANESNVKIGHVLLEESIRVRKGYKHQDNPSNLTVLTSWFYSECCFGLAEKYTPWTYLREATTQAQLLGMHDEDNYKGDPLDASHMRILYWVLFIAERTYALHDKRPTSLYATIYPPSLDEVASDRSFIVGLQIMIKMFQIIGDRFIRVWNEPQDNDTDVLWIPQIYKQMLKAVPKILACANGQRIEIHTTNVWLYLKIWQLSNLKYSLHEEDSFYDHLISIFDGEQIVLSIQSISKLLCEQDVTTLGKGLVISVQALLSLAVIASIAPAQY